MPEHTSESDVKWGAHLYNRTVHLGTWTWAMHSAAEPLCHSCIFLKGREIMFPMQNNNFKIHHIIYYYYYLLVSIIIICYYCLLLLFIIVYFSPAESTEEKRMIRTMFFDLQQILKWAVGVWFDGLSLSFVHLTDICNTTTVTVCMHNFTLYSSLKFLSCWRLGSRA